jgi:galactonate dehydratase
MPQNTALASKPAVAITDITAHAIQEPVGKRSYIVVVVKTDAGVSGVGEAALRADPVSAVARIVSRKRDLVGRDATAVEVIRQMFLSAAGLDGESAAIQGALNMALLDIAGKLARAPVYEVLGGPTRTKARALAWLGEPAGPRELLAEVQRAKAAGFRAMVVPFILPESPARGRGFYRQAVAALEALRSAAGDDLDFVLDCGGKLTPGVAAALARELERFHLLWLDEPVGDIDRSGLARISPRM